MMQEDNQVHNKKRQILSISLLYIILCVVGCHTLKQSNTNSRISLDGARRIAVLDFEQEGFLSGQRLGRFAADELTSVLFIRQGLRIVDRAQIRAKVMDKKITPTAMDVDEVAQIGRDLEADFLILGEITRLDGLGLDTEEDEESIFVQVSFRVLTTGNGSVIGIVTRQGSSKRDLKILVADLIKKMSDAVRLEG